MKARAVDFLADPLDPTLLRASIGAARARDRDARRQVEIATRRAALTARRQALRAETNVRRGRIED